MPSAFPAKMFSKSEHCDIDNYKLQVEILQQKLRKSEQQRQQLEDKFEKNQRKRAENEKYIRIKSREKFQEFLDQQRERNERNKKIIRMLESIDQQAAVLSERSIRLKAMKRQYELYFGRFIQSQAFRIQNTPCYSILPSNQYIPQSNELIPLMDSKNQATSSQSAPLYTGNKYQTIDDIRKQNIPSIVTMPATPPSGGLTSRTTTTNLMQPSQSILTTALQGPSENWSISAPNNNNYSDIPTLHTNRQIQYPNVNYIPGMNSGLPLQPQQYGNHFNYASQPNQFDFNNGSMLYNNPNGIQMQSQYTGFHPQQNVFLGQYGQLHHSWNNNIDSTTSNITNPYIEMGSKKVPNTSNVENNSQTMTPSHRSASPNQRTFRDFDRINPENSNKNIDRLFQSDPNTSSNEHNLSRANGDDINQNKELNSRNRLRTFSDSNENLYQNSNSNQNMNKYGQSDSTPEQQHPPSLYREDFRNRRPSLYSLSRSNSIDDEPTSFSKNLKADDNFDSQNDDGATSDKRQSDNSRSPRTNRKMSNEEKGHQSPQLNPTNQPNFDERQRPSKQQHTSPKSRDYGENRQSSPNSSNLSYNNNSPDPIAAISGGIRDLSLNNDKIASPSRNSNPSTNIFQSKHEGNAPGSPSTSSPQYYNNDGSNVIDKKKRPGLLKKIELPDYLLNKRFAEKNKENDEQTDTDIGKLNQPSGNVQSPTLFAKKEKLSLENIENAIYGELINPDISMSSIGSHEPITPLLRQHQTPAEIIAQTNQSRINLKSEISKHKLPGTEEVAKETIDQIIEKPDQSEKILRDNIEPEIPTELNTNPIKPLIENKIVEQQNVPIPITKPIESLPKQSSLTKNNQDLPTVAIPEITENIYENYEKPQQDYKTEPIYSNQILNEPISATEHQSTFDLETQNSDNTPIYDQNSQPDSDNLLNQDQYPNNASPQNDIIDAQQPLENETYPESEKLYTSANENDPNTTEFQADQQPYDTTQEYQQYNQQEYVQDQQNTYENYPTDPNYQADYDPNAYNYNYDQQQQGDATYDSVYDPSQQYTDQNYENQPVYQDPNYTDQQYAQQGYTEDQTSSNSIDPNQYDYSQANTPTEGYDQTQVNQPSVENSNEENIINNSETINETNPPVEMNAPSSQPKLVKPILTKDKSVDLEHKKKKRVNFVDSSDESSSKGQQQPPATTTDESDFDFSSQ